MADINPIIFSLVNLNFGQLESDDQCDQIGRFFKVLRDNFLTKVDQCKMNVWAVLKTLISCTNFCGYI